MHRARRHRLGALRRVAQNEDGFAECRCLLLNSARVREHDIHACHEIGERFVVQRVDEVHVRQLTQLLTHDFAYLRITVYGEYDLHVPHLVHDVVNGAVDVAHRLAEILAAMRRHEEDAVVLKVHLRKLRREHIVGTHGMVQGIDDGIARDEDALLRYPLCCKIIVCRRRRGKMQGRDAAREAAIHLLGER